MVTFIETKLFTKLLGDYLSDEEYAALQESLAATPEAGRVIKGSGGIRKLRWTLYAKNEAASIPAHVLKSIREEIDAEGT